MKKLILSTIVLTGLSLGLTSASASADTINLSGTYKTQVVQGLKQEALVTQTSLLTVSSNANISQSGAWSYYNDFNIPSILVGAAVGAGSGATAFLTRNAGLTVNVAVGIASTLAGMGIKDHVVRVYYRSSGSVYNVSVLR